MVQQEEAANQPKPNKSLIIAMKGHPGTGKSTLARIIAADLEWPILDKDDIYGACDSVHRHLDSTLINDLSYDSLYRLASTQLRLGLSVVIDSPLSSPSRLNRLLHIAAEYGASVVVIECKPADEAEWRRRLEGRGAAGGASWHKPATWEDLQHLVQSYGGCYDYDTGDVPKLVVDTTAAVVGIEAVLDFIRSHSAAPPQT